MEHWGPVWSPSSLPAITHVLPPACLDDVPGVSIVSITVPYAHTTHTSRHQVPSAWQLLHQGKY